MDWCTTIRSDITYAWTRAGVVVCIGWAAKHKPLASREIPQTWQFPALCQGAARQPVLHKTVKIVGLTSAKFWFGPERMSPTLLQPSLG